MDLQAKFADKIAKLIAKAEGTSNLEKAQTFIEGAQRLMTQYAVEQAMVDEARGAISEEILEQSVQYDGIYHQARFFIGQAIGEAQDCKVLHSSARGGKSSTLHCVGFKSDVERALFLDASVQLQALAALNRHAIPPTARTPMQKYKERREFLFGFSTGLRERLARARTAGVENAVTAISFGATTQEHDRVHDSVALVIRSRKDRVQDWVDTTYGKLRSRSSSYSSGSRDSHTEGRAAGLKADTGSAGNLRSRGALPK